MRGWLLGSGVIFLLVCLPVWVLAQPAPSALPTCPTPQSTDKTGARVAWAPPVLDPHVTPLGYEIWQQMDGQPWAKIADAPLAPAQFSVKDLAPGHTYTFGVKLVGKLAGGENRTGPFGTPDPAALSQCVAIVAIGFPVKVSVTPE